MPLSSLSQGLCCCKAKAWWCTCDDDCWLSAGFLGSLRFLGLSWCCNTLGPGRCIGCKSSWLLQNIDYLYYSEMVHTCNPNAAGTLQPFLPMQLTEKSSTHTLEFEYKTTWHGWISQEEQTLECNLQHPQCNKVHCICESLQADLQQQPNNERLMVSENLSHIHAMWQLTAWFALANIDVCFMWASRVPRKADDCTLVAQPEAAFCQKKKKPKSKTNENTSKGELCCLPW